MLCLSFPPFSVGSPRFRATWPIHDETQLAHAGPRRLLDC
jgi:hypothetical protein